MSEVFDIAGDVIEGQGHAKNARLLKRQARQASAAGYADEEAQRREARQFFGLQAAAMAESGGGYGGSNELLLRQSEVLAQLDALNIRFDAKQRRRALMAAKSQEKKAETASYLSAGSRTLNIGG